MARIWELLDLKERDLLTNIMPKKWRPPSGTETETAAENVHCGGRRVRKVARDRVDTGGPLDKD